MRSISLRFQGLGLQRRIMLYVTAGLVVFSALYGFAAVKATQQASELVFRERLLTAITAAGAMDDGLEHLQGELQATSLAVAPSLARNDLGTAQIPLHALYAHWTRFDTKTNPSRLSLTDLQGNLLWTEPANPTMSAQSLAQVIPSGEATQSNSAAFSVGSASDPSGSPTLLLTTPILSGARPGGYLVAELDRSRVGAWLESSLDARAPNGSLDGIQLVDASGSLIASLPVTASAHATAHFHLVASLWKAGQPGTEIHTQIENGQDHSHVIAFAPLTRVQWGLIVEQEEDEALALPRGLQTQLLGFGLFALLGGLGLAWLTTRTVVRPINALTRASQEIARGNLEHPLDVSGADEVGILARSFDEMRVDLKQSREEIARWNRELETRVQQRTRELSALVESAQALTSTLNLVRLLDIITAKTREVLPTAEGIAIFLFEAPTNQLVARSSFGFDVDPFTRLIFTPGEGIAGKAFESDSPTLLKTAREVSSAQANFQGENRERFREAVGDRQVVSALGVPLTSKGARLGVLMAYSFSLEDAFAAEDVRVLQALANAAAAAIENARLYAELAEKEEARAQLLEKVIQAQEEERQRVAREIHDELGQFLTRLSINLKLCEGDVAPHSVQAAERLIAAQTLVWQTIEQAHRLIVELRPTLLDELGLEAALREELKQRLEPLGLEAQLTVESHLERVPAPVGITIFRIAQEAITNIARHARARHAFLTLNREGPDLSLRIQDDGVGLPPDWRSSTNGHRPLGLLGMQERAGLLGGTLAIEPAAPHGTRLILRVPLAPDSPSVEL